MAESRAISHRFGLRCVRVCLCALSKFSLSLSFFAPWLSFIRLRLLSVIAFSFSQIKWKWCLFKPSIKNLWQKHKDLLKYVIKPVLWWLYEDAHNTQAQNFVICSKFLCILVPGWFVWSAWWEWRSMWYSMSLEIPHFFLTLNFYLNMRAPFKNDTVFFYFIFILENPSTFIPQCTFYFGPHFLAHSKVFLPRKYIFLIFNSQRNMCDKLLKCQTKKS